MRRTPLMGVESDKVPLSITLEYDRALLTGIMLTSLFSILNGTELFLIDFLFVKSLDIFEIRRNKSQRKIQGIPVKQVKLLRSTCAQRRYATMYKEYQGTTKKKKTKTFSSTRENDPVRPLIGKQQAVVVAKFSRLQRENVDLVMVKHIYSRYDTFQRYTNLQCFNLSTFQ